MTYHSLFFLCFQKRNLFTKAFEGSLKPLKLWGSLIAHLVKNYPAMQESLVRFPGQEDLLEKGQALHSCILGLPLWLSWQRIHPQCGIPGFNPWVRKIPWRGEKLATLVFWPGEFHVYLWGGKDSDMTERLSLSLENLHVMSLLCMPLPTWSPGKDKERSVCSQIPPSGFVDSVSLVSQPDSPTVSYGEMVDCLCGIHCFFLP